MFCGFRSFSIKYHFQKRIKKHSLNHCKTIYSHVTIFQYLFFFFFFCFPFSNRISNSKDKPRSMIVLLPEIRLNPTTKEKEPVVWQPWHEKEEMLACWHAGHFEHMSFWENKKPQYDEDLGAYTLDFDGRVTMASSKNFLLVSSHDIRGPVGVRFGRVEDSQFVMDVSWPCSPLQAMGIALASVLTKTTG